MNISEQNYSISSSLLNEEEHKKLRKKERKAYIYGIIAQIIWSLNSIQLKTYKQLFPKSYGTNNLILFYVFKY